MRLIACLFIFCLPLLALAQPVDANYDESKVPAYRLPDLLKTNDGRLITNKKDWEKIRRPELLALFASHEYGITPREKIRVQYRVVAENKQALNGLAYSRQVEFSFSGNNRTVKALLILYLPKTAKGKVPVFVSYNFAGNQAIHADPEIRESFSAPLNIWGNDGMVRGSEKRRWPLEYIIGNGYGVATMCYNDIYPDRPDYVDKSILPLFSDYTQAAQKPESWQAIGAWAWGMSRILDYLQTDKAIDPKQFIALGHSRLGKTALWAGAQDERFAIVISNNSGCGGAALFNRKFGETAQAINRNFPHWFCRNFRQYNNREEAMPVDQHGLIALMAPRPVYIASASEDLWADPKGEYLAGWEANPVYALWGLKGIDKVDPLVPNTPIQDGHIGYHLREGGHDILQYDWEQYIRFANRHFQR